MVCQDKHSSVASRNTIAPSVQCTHIFLLGVCDQSIFLLFASGKALAHFFLVNHILIVSFPTEVNEVDLGIHRL